LPILILLFLSAARGVCDSVSIIRVSDAKAVAKESSGFFDTYRDMVLTVDDAVGKVAIIQWGQYQSTIKIFNLADGKCAKHSVSIGRLNGIDGAEYYDFTADEYIFHDEKGLHFFGMNSKTRAVPNPLPKGYRASRIVPLKDGLLIEAGNCSGNSRGSVVYRYLQSNGSVKILYKSREGIHALGSGVDCAIVAEDLRGDYESRQIVKIGFDGQVRSKVKVPMLSPHYTQIKNNTLYEVDTSEAARCQLQEVELEKGTVKRKVIFADVAGNITSFDVMENIAFFGRSPDGNATAEVFDLKENKVLRRFSIKGSWSCLLLVKYKNELYCVVSS
jgi:hypothetical protein